MGCSYAVQHLLTPAVLFRRHACVDAAAADRRRRKGLLAQLILLDQLKRLRRGLEDVRRARLVGGKKMFAGLHERSGEFAIEAFFPLLLARIPLQTDSKAIVQDGIDV